MLKEKLADKEIVGWYFEEDYDVGVWACYVVLGWYESEELGGVYDSA